MVYQIYDYTIWLIVKIASLLHDHPPGYSFGIISPPSELAGERGGLRGNLKTKKCIFATIIR
jgi:hypothetical protein